MPSVLSKYLFTDFDIFNAFLTLQHTYKHFQYINIHSSLIIILHIS